MKTLRKLPKPNHGDIWPGLLPRAMSGPMVQSHLGSILMPVTYVATKNHTGCPRAMVSSGPGLLLRAMSKSVAFQQS